MVMLIQQKRINAANDLTVSGHASATDIWPDSQSQLPQVVRANPDVSRFLCGKRVRWLGWSRLTDLAQLQNLNYAEKCQELKFLRFSAVGPTSLGKYLRCFRPTRSNAKGGCWSDPRLLLIVADHLRSGFG